MRGSARLVLALVGSLLVSHGSANAASIVIFGSNSNGAVATFLNANGHTAVDVGAAAPNAAQLAGADVVIALRANGNADVASFVQNGGLLITEWSAAEWALDTANLVDADGGANLFIGTNTPITITPAGLAAGLGTGLANPFADGPRTEFQWTLSNIGAGVDIFATYGAGVPAVIGDDFGLGYAFINSLDWADGFNGGVSGQFLLNAINVRTPAAVPEPASLLLLGSGLVGLRAYRRRSRR